MCDIDEKLYELDNKRLLLNSHVNYLQNNHPKLHAKLIYIFNDLDLWMIDAKNYMNELKKYSVTADYKKQFEALRKNINDSKNPDFSEKHNKQNVD